MNDEKDTKLLEEQKIIFIFLHFPPPLVSEAGEYFCTLFFVFAFVAVEKRENFKKKK